MGALRRRYGRSTTRALKPGDKVRVRLQGSGIVQDGIVVRVNVGSNGYGTGDRFVWKNINNAERTARLSDIRDPRTTPLNSKHRDPYIQQWIDEGDGDE